MKPNRGQGDGTFISICAVQSFSSVYIEEAEGKKRKTMNMGEICDSFYYFVKLSTKKKIGFNML